MAGCRDCFVQHTRLQHPSRLLAQMVSGRLGDGMLPRSVPQLVLLVALDGNDDELGSDGRPRRKAAVQDLAGTSPRDERSGQADAQIGWDGDLVRRGGRTDRRRYHALDVPGTKPVTRPSFRDTTSGPARHVGNRQRPDESDHRWGGHPSGDQYTCR